MTPGCLSFSKKVTLWYGVLISFLAFLVTRYVSQTEEPLSDGALVSNDTSPQKKHFILLGSTGDLAIRYLLPALLTLQSVSRNGWIIHSASRQEPAEIQRVLFQKLTFDGADVDPEWSKFLSSLVPLRLSNDEDFQAFCQQVPSDSRILFYLSIPPRGYAEAVRRISQFCMEKRRQDLLTIVLEKPFGTDEASAQALFRDLTRTLSADRFYLVDHYKGKEAVQVIPSFFRLNPDIKDLITSNHVEHIGLVLNETDDVKNRIEFYEQTGVIRDVVQNHLTEILADILSLGMNPQPNRSEILQYLLIKKIHKECMGHITKKPPTSLSEIISPKRRPSLQRSFSQTMSNGKALRTGRGCYYECVCFSKKTEGDVLKGIFPRFGNRLALENQSSLMNASQDRRSEIQRFLNAGAEIRALRTGARNTAGTFGE